MVFYLFTFPYGYYCVSSPGNDSVFFCCIYLWVLFFHRNYTAAAAASTAVIHRPCGVVKRAKDLFRGDDHHSLKHRQLLATRYLINDNDNDDGGDGDDGCYYMMTSTPSLPAAGRRRPCVLRVDGSQRVTMAAPSSSSVERLLADIAFQWQRERRRVADRPGQRQRRRQRDHGNRINVMTTSMTGKQCKRYDDGVGGEVQAKGFFTFRKTIYEFQTIANSEMFLEED